jgi:hypothetical protein
MGVTVEIKGLDRLLAAFSKIPELAAKNMRVAVKEGLQEVEDYASRNHAYTRRSGRADAAYRMEIDETGLSGTLQLDGVISNAPYVFPLHEGHKAYRVAPVNKKALYWVKNGQEYIVLKAGWKNPKPKPGWMFKAGILGGDMKKSKDGKIWSHKGFCEIPAAPGDPWLYRAMEAKREACLKLINEAMQKTIKEAGF